MQSRRAQRIYKSRQCHPVFSERRQSDRQNLEQELGLTLLTRGKEGIHLTADGEAIFPYIQAIANAEDALARRQREMQGLKGSVIRIGTFTSVSRTLLPGWMIAFKRSHSGVRFVLEQGEYTTITEWVKNGAVDFGFVNMDAAPEMEGRLLYADEMCAVLPPDHVLTRQKKRQPGRPRA